MKEVARRGRLHSATAVSSGCLESHGVAVCTPRQQQQHQQQQLQHEVEEKADAEEEQRGVNACSIREKSHDRRLAMCSPDIRKGDGEGISHVAK